MDKLNEPDLLDDSVSFGQAREADVIVHPQSYGKVEGFIDEIMYTGWLSECWKRLAGALLLSIHIFALPLASNEPISRDDLLSLNKLISKDSPSEIKLDLGWLIDIRIFSIRLPEDKFGSWIAQKKSC